MKPGSQQALFNFPGRLNFERWSRPVQAVICTLVAIKNVGVPCVSFNFHLTHSMLLNLNCPHMQVRFCRHKQMFEASICYVQLAKIVQN